MAPMHARQRSLFPPSSDGMKIPTPKPEDIRRRFRSWRIMFPQMTNWLPDDEAEDLKDAFVREIDRWGDEARDIDED